MPNKKKVYIYITYYIIISNKKYFVVYSLKKSVINPFFEKFVKGKD